MSRKKSRQQRAKSAPFVSPSAVQAQVSDTQVDEQLQDQASEKQAHGQVLEQLHDSDENVLEPAQQERAADRSPEEQAQEVQAEEAQAEEAQAQAEQSLEPGPDEHAKKHATKRAKHAHEHGRMQVDEHQARDRDQVSRIEPPAQHSSQVEPHADIRGVLIQLAGARLLLPNANIAEVLSYAPPEPVDTAPEWLLGKMRWRGWQLPLVAFAELAGLGKEPAGLGSKVVVLKALGGNPKAPYFAILTQGFPRLVTVSQEALPDADNTELPPGVLGCVMMNEDTAFVPDLVAVEGMINDALAEAA